MAVMIGVDPHKGSHTAVAIDGDETQIAAVTVHATRRQVSELLRWAARFEKRTWAIESAGGLGYLLARQLVAAGEQVLDVPATFSLGCWAPDVRTRTTPTTRCPWRSPRCVHLAWLGRSRRAFGGVAPVRETQPRSGPGPQPDRVSAARPAGGARSGRDPKEINARSAERLLATVEPVSPVERARHGLALEHLEDLRRFDEQMRASKTRIAAAVTESGTTLTELFGVGPIVAAMVIGYTGDVTRFRNRDHFAAYTGTAPIEVSSGGRITHRLSRPGNRQLNHAIHIAAITQIRSRTLRAGRSSSAKSRRARRNEKLCAR